MSSYDPIVIPTASPSSLVLTHFQAPESDASAFFPIVTALEGYGGGGYVFADIGKGYDIGYGIQVNGTNLPWIA